MEKAEVCIGRGSQAVRGYRGSAGLHRIVTRSGDGLRRRPVVKGRRLMQGGPAAETRGGPSRIPASD